MVEKNVKRFLVLGILGLFIISMMGGVLGDDYSDEVAGFTESVMTGVIGFFGTFFEPLFGEKEMLSRVFFALLLGMIIYSIISTMFNSSSRWIQWGITGVITSLALMGLPSEFLEVIRTQYGAMGATILTMVPFLIVLMFSLKSKNLLIARVTWLFYAMYYFAMFAYMATIKGGFFTTESMPYGIAFFVGILIFFGLPAIRNLLFKGEIEGLIEGGMNKVQKRKAANTINDADLTARTGVPISP